MKNKRIDQIRNVMSKSGIIFTENFAIFFFNEGRAENVSEFKFDKF